MSYTLQQTINWASAYIEGSPLSAWTGSEPAISIASTVRSTIMNAPMTWAWNRKEDSSTSTVAGTQDYTVALTDFGFLEKVSLLATAGSNAGEIYEMKDVYNTVASSVASKQQRPNSCCVIANTPGTSIKIRFMGVPDAVYTVTLVYQVASVLFSTLSDNWSPVPDQYLDAFNNLFLSEALQVVDDARSAIYRTRGVAALLSKAEGLTATQVNAFLSQWGARNSQQASEQMRVSQGAQSRGV